MIGLRCVLFVGCCLLVVVGWLPFVVFSRCCHSLRVVRCLVARVGCGVLVGLFVLVVCLSLLFVVCRLAVVVSFFVFGVVCLVDLGLFFGCR